VTTRKQRRSARSRPDLEPRVEEREIPASQHLGEGGRDFFGGLFGGEPGLARPRAAWPGVCQASG